MSIATTVRTAGPFAGTGSLVALPFAFKVFTASDLVVQRTNVAGDVATLTLTTHYSVSLNADQDTSPGGTVTLVTALAVGETAALTSSVSATQPLQLASGGPFLPGQIEDALDRAMIVVQQQGVLGEQTLRVPLGETALILPGADQRANKALLFDADGDPYLAAPASGSAADLALSIASTASGKGAALVGFDWLLAYEQDTVGAAIRQASQGANVLRWIAPELWAGLQAGTVTTDVITAAVNSAKATGKTIIIPDGTYYTDTGLDLTGFSGKVLCSGAIKAKASTTIAHLVDFSGASGFEWHGGVLDFTQTSSTADGDARSDHGFYMLDARDGKIHGVRFDNIRIGEVVYINGTSSVSPSAAHGSKRIQVWGCSCVAFAPPGADVGAAVYIRSDFYAGDGGGLYMAATNGMKVADYTLDASVAYQRTTTDIQFWGNRFENFDGFRMFNVARVTCSNQQLLNFYTRGYTCSPSCEDVQVTGGIVSGNAAHINVNYACKRCTFSDLIAQGEQTAAGQRHTLRTGFGSTDVTFSNIVGFGNDTRHVFVEGAARVKFIGVNLRNWIGGNTTVAVSIAGGGASNTSSWVTDDIKFIGCTFQSNYGIRFDDNAGTATIADGAVVCDEATRFDYALGLFQGSGYSGKVSLHLTSAWTPILRGASVAGSHTYSVQQGTRSIKGNICYFTANIALSSKDASMSGAVQIAGMPDTAANVSNRLGAASIGYASNVTFTGYSGISAAVQPNTAYVSLYKYGTGSGGANLSHSDIASTTQFQISGWYYI